MEENNNLEIIEMEPETELMEYEDNSSLVSGLVGLGIGIAGTLLAKKGVKAVKKLWKKRKEKKAVEEDFEDDLDDCIEEDDFEDEEETSTEK